MISNTLALDNLELDEPSINQDHVTSQARALIQWCEMREYARPTKVLEVRGDPRSVFENIAETLPKMSFMGQDSYNALIDHVAEKIENFTGAMSSGFLNCTISFQDQVDDMDETLADGETRQFIAFTAEGKMIDSGIQGKERHLTLGSGGYQVDDTAQFMGALNNRTHILIELQAKTARDDVQADNDHVIATANTVTSDMNGAEPTTLEAIDEPNLDVSPETIDGELVDVPVTEALVAETSTPDQIDITPETLESSPLEKTTETPRAEMVESVAEGIAIAEPLKSETKIDFEADDAAPLLVKSDKPQTPIIKNSTPSCAEPDVQPITDKAPITRPSLALKIVAVAPLNITSPTIAPLVLITPIAKTIETKISTPRVDKSIAPSIIKATIAAVTPQPKTVAMPQPTASAPVSRAPAVSKPIAQTSIPINKTVETPRQSAPTSPPKPVATKPTLVAHNNNPPAPKAVEKAPVQPQTQDVRPHTVEQPQAPKTVTQAVIAQDVKVDIPVQSAPVAETPVIQDKIIPNTAPVESVIIDNVIPDTAPVTQAVQTETIIDNTVSEVTIETPQTTVINVETVQKDTFNDAPEIKGQERAQAPTSPKNDFETVVKTETASPTTPENNEVDTITNDDVIDNNSPSNDGAQVEKTSVDPAIPPTPEETNLKPTPEPVLEPTLEPTIEPVLERDLEPELPAEPVENLNPQTGPKIKPEIIIDHNIETDLKYESPPRDPIKNPCEQPCGACTLCFDKAAGKETSPNPVSFGDLEKRTPEQQATFDAKREVAQQKYANNSPKAKPS